MIPKGRQQKPKLPAEVPDFYTILPQAILAPEFKAKPPSGKLRLGYTLFQSREGIVLIQALFFKYHNGQGFIYKLLAFRI